jgi:hypothetical protein
MVKQIFVAFILGICVSLATYAAIIRIANADNRSIHAEWGYTPPSAPAVSGFKLYQEGVFVCSTNIGTASSMDCNVTITKLTTSFTLTATFVDGTESPQSAPYAFTLPAGSKLPQNFKITIN